MPSGASHNKCGATIVKLGIFSNFRLSGEVGHPVGNVEDAETKGKRKSRRD